MIKKTIEYEDYNGVMRKEDFYFNLTKAELALHDLKSPGGAASVLQKIIDSSDQEKIVEWFEWFVEKSYGEKSEDGRNFNKSPEIFKSFSSTEAYSELIIELVSDAKAAADFVNGIIPKVSPPAETGSVYIP